MFLTLNEKLIVVAVFLLYGLIGAIKPQLLAKYQVWVNKKILGAKFEPSGRTIAIYRAFGLLFILLGITVFLFG